MHAAAGAAEPVIFLVEGFWSPAAVTMHRGLLRSLVGQSCSFAGVADFRHAGELLLVFRAHLKQDERPLLRSWVTTIWCTLPSGSGCDCSVNLSPETVPCRAFALVGQLRVEREFFALRIPGKQPLTKCLPSLTAYRMPTCSFLIFQIHSAVSIHEPLVELRTGCPVPRQPPTSGLNSASAPPGWPPVVSLSMGRIWTRHFSPCPLSP